ncbi:sphingomyelin phosphodiesterase 5-like [Pseudophryne corroboree]|uniref:sphingomyelin phosphodiesterase 5-like n=1 Tax=Pseudophryne corroboree TaxID=495146 RepID=UPI0030818C89
MLQCESPFSCLFLHTLFSLSCVLLFPSYWFIDRLLSCVVLTSRERSQGPALRILSLVLGVPFFLLLFLLSLPLSVLGFVFWAPLHRARRPFCYQRHLQTHSPPEKILQGDCLFIFISANLCLLPDGLARFSNLSHTQHRTSLISKFLSLPAEPVQTSSEDSLPICSTEDVLPILETPDKKEQVKHGEGDFPFDVSLVFPQNADFLCLQEVFDGRASRKLRRCLAPSFPHILYDVGPSGPHSGGFKFFNSGLFLASRHPLINAKYYFYPNARGEDALASKGLLCVKVHIGLTEQKQRIVGYINCTHLHAPESKCEPLGADVNLFLLWYPIADL